MQSSKNAFSQTRVVIIHGYGIHIETPLQKPKGEDAGFSAFQPLISAGQAVVFRWALPHVFGFPQALDPRYLSNVYWAERALLEDQKLYQQLAAFLKKHQPTVVMGHSLGAEVLRRFVLNHQLPPSVSRIITVQADMPRNIKLSTKLEKELTSKRLSWENYWCWWDQALMVGSLVHRSPRAGLVGLNHPLVKNKFFPLYRSYNLHVSSMLDPAFVKYLHLQ